MFGKKITIYNRYYYRDLKQLIKYLANGLANVSVVNSFKEITKPKTEYIAMVNTIGEIEDVQEFFASLRKVCLPQTKLIIIYYNYLWEPVLKLAEYFGFKKPQKAQNWLTLTDIENLLHLTDFVSIKKGQRLLLPVYVPLLSTIVNNYIARLPIINHFCLTNYIVARPIRFEQKDYVVSIIVPARNEEGNISTVMKHLPKIGRKTEVIFVEGHSKDRTWEKILGVKKRYRNISAYKQQGIGKADAVRLGISKAVGDIIIILDADLSVPPGDLVKFYEALSSGRGEFINGSRLVYPLEKDSMRFLNKIGNKFFSIMFSWILKARFTDTLCGTKAFFRSDYQRIQSLRKYFGDFDPFGDYELIFGATKLNLKIVEIPVRYKARTYGESNISRFTHGWLLVKMLLYAVKKFKFDL